jgi:hypothetical protein
LALLGCTVAACNSDKKQPAPRVAPSALAASSHEAHVDAPRPEPYADVSLPDETDFADEADKEISADNYTAKLGELEKEIAEAEADGGLHGAADAGGAPPAASATAEPKARPADDRAPSGKARQPSDATGK